MSPECILEVRRSWSKFDGRHAEFERSFLDRLREFEPELSTLMVLAGGGQPRGNLAAMLGGVVASLGDPSALMAMSAAVGRRIGEFGIVRRDYEAVGAALLRALEGELRGEFSSATRRAWRELLALLAGTMIRAQAPMREPRRDA